MEFSRKDTILLSILVLRCKFSVNACEFSFRLVFEVFLDEFQCDKTLKNNQYYEKKECSTQKITIQKECHI